ncbi:MAG: endolytic transglycosylase MltG [Leeuwenhoekiella sp.]
MYIKRIVLIIALIGLVAAAIFAYVVYGKFFEPNTSFENKEAFIFIPTNATFTEVKKELQPLIEDMESFEAVAERKGYIANVKSGRYRIAKGSNNNEIVNSIRSGNIPIKVSFNNQERLPNLAARIAQQIEADSTSLYQSFIDTEFLKEQGLTEATAMTLYLPNTYELYWNSSAKSFRDKMVAAHDRFWNENRRAKAEALNLNPEEVYTLASIVQKETAKVDERPRVAGVYLNRYRNNWKLDADPTVIFAKKKAENDFGQIIKRVLYADLTLDSPYNTYKYQGLPPGPIFMPDRSSIEAVLNPEGHDYYFFVADVSKPGYHLFAKTLAQHNRNRVQYINWINAQGVNR